MRLFLITILSVCLTGVAAAQRFVAVASLAADGLAVDTTAGDGSLPASYAIAPASRPDAALAPPVALPRMAPELALETYQSRVARQNAELASYSAVTVIRAELPDTSQKGEFELKRLFSAPRSLVFKAIQFTGDNFVKSNVITRLLQSEVDHVQKDDSALTAITPANYKFSYKGASQVENRLVHVYQVKPRQKRPGLFKGRIYLDAHTGSLVRAEGNAVKSPSFFIKKIEFMQDYADFDSFTFPVHIHSEARARLVGRAIVDIYHRDYQPVASTVRVAHNLLVSPMAIPTP